MLDPPFRSWVEISLSRLAANYRAVTQAVGAGTEVAAVVKADAYRHGAPEIARALVEAGCRWLAVSSVEEGIALREAGTSARILIMAGYFPYELDSLWRYDLTPAIHSLAALRDWDALCVRAGQSLPFHLKIDTGMGRLGARAAASEILDALSAVRNAAFEGLMTHFASAADFQSPQTEEQIQVYDCLVRALRASSLRPRYFHLASTNAVAYPRSVPYQNMVRPGHAIYGYLSPARGNSRAPALSVEPILTWKTRVLEIKEIPAGAPVGYAATFRAPQPMRIAILSAGYADGIFHRLSNKGKVIAHGILLPMLGSVSMDLTTIDATPCPALKPGDAVLLLGAEGGVRLDALQIARAAGTISYNILCSISARVKRVYV